MGTKKVGILKKLRSLGINLALLLVTSLICLVSAEMILRIWYFNSLELMLPNFRMHDTHPILGWTLKPNSTFFRQTVDYQVRIDSNSLGYNDVEHEVEPQKGTRRILLLGDSFTEAGQVPFEQSMGRILQKELGRQNTEIINMGINAYGTAQAYLTLVERGISYRPDLVILLFCPNDVGNNSRELMDSMHLGKPDIEQFGRPYFEIDPASDKLLLVKPDYERSLDWSNKRRKWQRKKYESKSYIERLLLYSTLSKFIKRYQDPRNGLKYKRDPNILFGPYLNDFLPEHGLGKISRASEYERMWDTAWRVTCRLLGRIKQTCAKQGSGFLIVTVPVRRQVDPAIISRIKSRRPEFKFDFDLVNRRLKACAYEKGISFLDILPLFREVRREKGITLFHQIKDFHWNSRGHQVAASAVLERLRQHRIMNDI